MTLKNADERIGSEVGSAWGPGGPGLPVAKVLSDEPIHDPAQDRLDYGAYADALGELIDNADTATPLTLSISGPWGAGKTSLARLIEHRLDEWSRLRGDPPHIVCWFNAWMHSDAPKLGPALAAVVGKTVAKERPLWQRLLRPLPSAMLSPEERWRRRVLLLAISAVIALCALFTPVWHLLHEGQAPDLSAKRLSVSAAVFVALPIAATLWSRVFSVAQAAASFVDDPKSQAATGSMADVNRQLSQLVRSATRGRRRLVIFIDDLERCQLKRAIEISETANLLLAQNDVVTVLIGDLLSLREFARKHYAGDQQEGVPGNGSDGFGRSYFDKIVQIEFALPPPGRAVPGLLLADPDDHRRTDPSPQGRVAARTSIRATGSGKGPARRALDVVAGTPRRYLALLGVCAAVLLVDSILLGALYPNTSQDNGAWYNLLATIVIVAALTPVVAAPYVVWRWVKARRRRVMSANLDEALRRSIAASPGPNVGSVDEAVSESRSDIEASTSTRRASERLIEHRARRVVVEGLVREANVTMLPYMPRLPRSVKRVVNREYLLIAIAVSRNMMGGIPALEPAHLGKWAIILERWPEVATAISRDPAQAGLLEGATAQPPSLPGDVLWTDDLKSLMHSEIRIGPIADRMVTAARRT